MVAGRDGELRIGLTLAGAIALGAYEGGVLAALVAAAQGVRRSGSDALRIDAIAGASAGSITGVLTARALVAGLDPIDTMYGAWVTTPQLEELRDGSASPLSTERTRKSSAELLRGTPHPGRAQTHPVELHMALGCLRGLDYLIGRIGGPPVEASTFLDWSEWTVEPNRDLEWYLADNGCVHAALASGAHAAAFPPIGLDRTAKDVRDAYIRHGIKAAPDFLWYTDGGTIDNEPLGRALDITEKLDTAAGDPLGAACRLHLLITPDPARPNPKDARWAERGPAPPWAYTGLRTLKLLRQQRLYDDLRRAEKTNSRLEWVKRLELTLLSIMEGREADPEGALRQTVGQIKANKEALATGEDLRTAEERPDTSLAGALSEAIAAATGLAGKREVGVAVISPLVLPDVASGRKAPRDLLAGEFLGHFGGFMNVQLRENDFAVGYDSMTQWIDDGGLERYGLAAEHAEQARLGAHQARKTWETENGRPWTQSLGEASLSTRPMHERVTLYKIALRSAWNAFQQVRRG